MEKRSRRRTRDLVTQAASQGLSENEIGCARISMMARSTNAPCKGRIQMRKTNPLHLFTFGLQRTAGPYRSIQSGQSLPVARRWAGCKVRSSPKADLIPIPACLSPSITEEYDHAGSSECDSHAP